MWSLDKLSRRPELPVRIVSREEFIRAFTDRGETLAKAELQAKWACGLGSEVMVGDEYLKINQSAT